MRRCFGVWLGLLGWLLASELVSGCGDVWGQAIVPASEDIAGGSGGAAGGNTSGGAPAPEGGAAGTVSSGGTATVGGSGGSTAGGSTGGGGSVNGGSGGSSGSAGQPSCPLLQVGYSTVSGGTIGGVTGTVVKVSTAAELRTQVTKTEPMIVQIDSKIALTEQIRPKSDKTILGVGKNAELTGAGLYILDVHNVIVQNLKISKAPEDAISIQNAQHVWIDHCDLSSDLTEPKDTYDDLLAVTHGSDYVTVSWTHFHDHYAVSLVGHSNDPIYAAEDIDHLTVTYHHNFFSNVQSNNPRVRYGKVHVFNNLFQNVAENAVISQMGAQLYVEGNVFQSVLIPITTQYQDPDEGGAFERDNSFSADSGPNVITTPSSWMPSSAYSYNADSTGTVEFLVNACAGVGKL